MHKVFSVYSNNPNDINHKNLHDAKKEIKNKFENLQAEHLEEMIKQVEIADDRRKHKLSWELINRITDRKSAKKGIIKGNSKEERILKWYDHFSNLLGNEPPTNDQLIEEDIGKILYEMNIDDGDFRLEELQIAKLKLCEGKASGPDGIPPEVIKRCNFDDIILDLSNKLLIENVIPEQWTEINLLPIPKSGDLS